MNIMYVHIYMYIYIYVYIYMYIYDICDSTYKLIDHCKPVQSPGVY